MKRLASLLASWIVRYPGRILAGGAILALGATSLLTLRQNFDTDVLNLLPGGYPSVQGLKIYNSDFTQTRELAFLLTWPKPSADNSRDREAFAALLRQQPWVVRILDTPPLESTSDTKETTEIVVPLLLNLPPDQFQAAWKNLIPDALATRIHRLSEQMAAGSPKARFELQTDPLGLAGPAAQPVWKTISVSDTFNLTLPDNSAAIVPVVTNQMDTSAGACQTMMATVHKFVAETEKKLGPDGPRIKVTGRSAYVDEIAYSMQRDIAVTSCVSLLAVIAIFWLGFRRFLPLLGITLILALTALLAMCAGLAVFNQLNIIAISFCSILFGLGDDFSLLLCQHFFQSRNAGATRQEAIESSIYHCLPGMLWVALTTGVGFLALFFSGSSGFAQLGFLIAAGVFLCAILMPLLLFPFLREGPPVATAAAGATWMANQCERYPKHLLGFGAGVVLLIAGVLVWPGHQPGFDISPSSLQPKNAPAARTLAEMMEKFPGMFEPVMVVLPHPDPAQVSALNQTLQNVKETGLIEAFSSPSGLLLDPSHVKENKAFLEKADFRQIRSALDAAIAQNGLRALPPAADLLNALEKESTRGKPGRWSDYLSPSSRWWFLLDRMVSSSTPAAIAYLKVSPSMSTDDRSRLQDILTQAVPGALVSGLSQTLASLIPWAKHELALFGSAVVALVLIILGVIYRDIRILLLHSLSILGAVAGTVATLKLLQVPLNLLNVLAFPLMLGVGVDYGTHLILAARQEGENLAGTLKAVGLSGLTTATGFGALVLAQNPSLSGMGLICGVGVIWCLFFSLVIVAPGMAFILATGRLKSSGDTRIAQ